MAQLYTQMRIMAHLADTIETLSLHLVGAAARGDADGDPFGFEAMRRRYEDDLITLITAVSAEWVATSLYSLRFTGSCRINSALIEKLGSSKSIHFSLEDTKRLLPHCPEFLRGAVTLGADLTGQIGAVLDAIDRPGLARHTASDRQAWIDFLETCLAPQPGRSLARPLLDRMVIPGFSPEICEAMARIIARQVAALSPDEARVLQRTFLRRADKAQFIALLLAGLPLPKDYRPAATTDPFWEQATALASHHEMLALHKREGPLSRYLLKLSPSQETR